MPLNKEVFKTRAISAMVFVAVMLAGLLWNHWSFLLLFSIIHFGCWREYLQLQEKIHGVSYHFFERLGLMLMGFALMLAFCGDAYQLAGYSLRGNLLIPVSGAGIGLFVYGLFQNRQVLPTRAIGAAFGGMLYISLAWGLMLALRQRNMESLLGDMGWLYPILLIASIWINDTMAYIVGSMIGKTPLSPISPKKTWEGTVGGALLAVALVSGAAIWWAHTSPAVTVAITATAAIMGTLGDLLESWLKRRAGVKDSGQMMPGHGGFLDRFDSMLLATPFVWAVVWILGV